MYTKKGGTYMLERKVKGVLVPMLFLLVSLTLFAI